MNGLAPNAPAIAFRRVTKDYVTDWRGRARRALREVDFEVGAGEICALVGPNGSGKTTLLKIAAGLTSCTAGSCEVGGRLGLAPDELDLPAYLTPQEALTRFGQIDGLASAPARAAAEQALVRLGLADATDRPLREFSKGLRQRVAVAQALLGEPEILLLDEPASALDPRAIEQLADVLRSEREAGRTVLLSSHFLPQTEEVADQFVVLDGGRVLWRGRRGELAERGGLRAVYLEVVRS